MKEERKNEIKRKKMGEGKEEKEEIEKGKGRNTTKKKGKNMQIIPYKASFPNK